jgi:hypothetical protein
MLLGALPPLKLKHCSHMPAQFFVYPLIQNAQACQQNIAELAQFQHLARGKKSYIKNTGNQHLHTLQNEKLQLVNYCTNINILNSQAITQIFMTKSPHEKKITLWGNVIPHSSLKVKVWTFNGNANSIK